MKLYIHDLYIAEIFRTVGIFWCRQYGPDLVLGISYVYQSIFIHFYTESSRKAIIG